ncbi:hypothetical protein FACS1894170_10240 [Planctomycetales bacterium]|nr:hypothetical protein FACS1894170_10240 [Planctomycetales bacterium]
MTVKWQSKQNGRVKNSAVKLATQLVELYNEKAEALVSPKLHRIEEKITYCEDKINEIVYQLYGLADEEIAVIEGKDKDNAV